MEKQSLTIAKILKIMIVATPAGRRIAS